ncbi:hypothetical protein IJH24_03515 [Candidatus Saccharibacteria bacterium]|nr:hypothetical protein [Candidatus Saccharibacteria bacterium]
MTETIKKIMLFKRISKKNLHKLFYAFQGLGLDALLISVLPGCKDGRLFYMASSDEPEDFDELYLSTHRLLNALKTELARYDIKLQFELDATRGGEK